MTERTLVILKPDAVERQLVGEIIGRIERKQLSIVALEQRVVGRSVAEAHYGEHAGKPFFEDLITFITRGPVVLAVAEGTEAITVWRNLVGATNPREAAPGTVRGDLAIEVGENLVHGSDSPESAAREIALWFPDL